MFHKNGMVRNKFKHFKVSGWKRIKPNLVRLIFELRLKSSVRIAEEPAEINTNTF